MRIAIVSDIHANLQAWNAVWLDIRSLAADRVICLGDTVGYGPNPAEVLESLYTTVDYFLLGNHDAAICGKLSPDLFNSTARGAIEWTIRRLSPRARQVFDGWPLTLAGPGFRCAHGEFGRPEYFDYVFEAADTAATWPAVDEPLLFIGHTHLPGLHVIGASGTPHTVEVQDFTLEPGKRFLVNAGSVGCPRDGDPRAGYCLYDTGEQAVFWRRVPYDLDAFRQAAERAGLPPEAAGFLDFDPRRERRPLRERVSFRPPDRADQAVRDTVEVQRVERLRRRVRHWQIVTLGAVLLLLAMGGAAGRLAWRQAHRRLVVPGRPLAAVRAQALSPGDNALAFPEAPVPAGEPADGWEVRLDNRYRQQAAWRALPDGRLGWHLQSGAAQDLRISSAPLYAAPGLKFVLQGRVWKSGDFRGTLALAVALDRRAGSGVERLDQFVVREPLQRRADGWASVKHTFELPARAESLRVEIRGRFTGSAAVCDLVLERK